MDNPYAVKYGGTHRSRNSISRRSLVALSFLGAFALVVLLVGRSAGSDHGPTESQEAAASRVELIVAPPAGRCGSEHGEDLPECKGKDEAQCKHMTKFEKKCKWIQQAVALPPITQHHSKKPGTKAEFNYTLIGHGFCTDGAGAGFNQYRKDDSAEDLCKLLCTSVAECVGFTFEVSSDGCILHTAGEAPTYSGSWDDTKTGSGAGDLGGSTHDPNARCYKKVAAATNATSVTTTTTKTITTSATTTSTKTTTVTTTVTTTRAISSPTRGPSCAACTPKRPMVPDVIIPTWERDLCKLKYTVRSVAMHDPRHHLGDIRILWVSNKKINDYQDRLNEIKKSVGANKTVYIHDFEWQVNHFPKSGWFAQQILKLKIAAIIKSDFYLVLDSKNTVIRDIEADTMFTKCNQAKVFGQYEFDELPGLHADWFKTSAKFLGVPPPTRGYWPASVTPVLMCRQSVLAMLAQLGESSSPYNLCSGPLCDMLDKGATEFTLYLDYAHSRSDWDCTHSVVRMDYSHDVSLSLWRGAPNNAEKCRNVAAGTQVPVMFGVQAGALDDMPPAQRKDAVRDLEKIYAALHDPSEDLVQCIG